MPVYSWNFDALETTTAGALQDVVSVVHWRLMARDGAHSVEVYGAVTLDAPAASGFVAFDALTPAIVEGWVSAKIEDLDALKASLAGQLAALAAAPVVKAPPWAE